MTESQYIMRRKMKIVELAGTFMNISEAIESITGGIRRLR